MILCLYLGRGCLASKYTGAREAREAGSKDMAVLLLVSLKMVITQDINCSEGSSTNVVRPASLGELEPDNYKYNFKRNILTQRENTSH